MRRRPFVAWLLCLGLALAACSPDRVGGDSTPTAAPSPETTDADPNDYLDY